MKRAGYFLEASLGASWRPLAGSWGLFGEVLGVLEAFLETSCKQKALEAVSPEA
jgi:hypothetical protein